MRLDGLLSLGKTETTSDLLERHLRVANALALFGVVLALTAIPLDVIGAPLGVVVSDVLGALAFASCWLLHARGRLTSGRVMLMLTSNLVLAAGILHLGGAAELRSVFFPLALMPFLVFSITERRWLVVFVALPIAEYFVLGNIPGPPPGLAHKINVIYAPVLSFVMIVTGSYVFASINRSAEQKLMTTRARAANSARFAALGEMSGSIAHEIRNPLAAIHLAASELAERPLDAGQVSQLGERIQRIVTRASKIIETLRSFTRDAGSDPFVSAPVERIVSDAVELCEKRVAEHGVALTVCLVPPDLVLECRPVQLSQVLMNLIGNACDAVANVPDRSIRIEVNATDAHVELAVSNSGPPIPAEVRTRIFEPFFTTKPPDRGTGLGLSLSRGIVETHHGTLELDATSSTTRFVMRIPRTQPRAVVVV